MNERMALVRTDGEPSRVDRAVSWVGWHLGELGGVGVPLVLAVGVSPWWAAVSGVVAAGWVAHELHTRHAATSADRAVDASVTGAAPVAAVGQGQGMARGRPGVSGVDGQARGGGVA